jgi:hypothetical protein
VLGEFLAAAENEVDRSLVEDGPLERFPTVEAKTVSSVSIATLGEILGVGSYEDLLERARDGWQADSGEAGIEAVLPEIQEALASAADLGLIAERWAATEELEDWEPADVHDVVRELSTLARLARADGRRLWFWWAV